MITQILENWFCPLSRFGRCPKILLTANVFDVRLAGLNAAASVFYPGEAQGSWIGFLTKCLVPFLLCRSQRERERELFHKLEFRLLGFGTQP